MRRISLTEGRIPDGDYPGLDINSQSPLSGKRRDRPKCSGDKKAPAWGLVAALLVAVVVMMVDAGSVGARTIISMAIDHPSRIPKSIVIFDASPNINIKAVESLVVRFNPLLAQTTRSTLDSFFWGNENLSFFDIDVFKVIFLTVARRFNFNAVADMSRWQVAPVNEGNMSDNRPVTHFVQQSGPSAQVSALQNAGISRLVSNSHVSNNTQTYCCGDQNKSEGIQGKRVIRKPFIGGHIFLISFGVIVAWSVIIGLAIRT
jgi:hypothetical protein